MFDIAHFPEPIRIAALAIFLITALGFAVRCWAAALHRLLVLRNAWHQRPR